MDSKPEVDLSVGTRHVILDKYVVRIIKADELTVTFVMGHADLPHYGMMTEVGRDWFVNAVNFISATSQDFHELAATPSPVECCIKGCEHKSFGPLTSELRICPFHIGNIFMTIENHLIKSGRVVLAKGQVTIT